MGFHLILKINQLLEMIMSFEICFKTTRSEGRASGDKMKQTGPVLTVLKVGDGCTVASCTVLSTSVLNVQKVPQ